MTRASAILLLLLTLLLAPRPNSYGRSDWARTDGAVLLASGDDSAHRRQKDLAAPSRSFLTTLQSAVRVHRRSLAGDGRFIVHVVGSVPKIEGRVAWPYAGHHACDKTTMVLVGREMPDEDPPKDHVDGCDTRFVRGAYVPANLERGLDDPRERLPDMVILFNADAWGCQWRRTMLNLLSPRLDLIDGSRTVGRFDDVSGAPVIVTGYAYEDVSKIERMVNERSRWFSTRELRKCDAAVEDAYGEAVSGGDANWGMESDEMPPGTPVVHWVTSPNRPEDNAPGDPNAYWFSFSPGLGGVENGRKGSSVGVVDGDLAVGASAVVILLLAVWRMLRR